MIFTIINYVWHCQVDNRVFTICWHLFYVLAFQKMISVSQLEYQSVHPPLSRNSKTDSLSVYKQQKREMAAGPIMGTQSEGYVDGLSSCR